MLPSPVPLILARDAHRAGVRVDRDRALVRVRRGVYAPLAAWNALQPWERYLVRVHAVALTWPDVIFCLESAAALLGLPVFGEPRDVHVLSGDGSGWRKGDVVVHAGPVTETVSDGLLATTDALRTARDLARVLPPAFGLAVADAVLRRLELPVGALDLRAKARSEPNRRGIRRLEWIDERATPLAESAGESVGRAVIEWAGFESPELQIAVTIEGRTVRPDYLWRSARASAEFDGWGKYGLDDPPAARAAVRAEKLREDLLRRGGLRTARWGWPENLRVEPVVQRLIAIRVPRPSPPQHALLRTLAGNPRSLDHRNGPVGTSRTAA